MKRKILLIVGVVLAIVLGVVGYTVFNSNRLSPKGVANLNQNNLQVTVKYSRPFKKGRLLFGESGSGALENYNEPWRTGANEATEIEISQSLQFPEGQLAAGRYSLYSIPGEKEWTIVFNSKLNYWGADYTGNPFEPSLDVLRVTVPRQKNLSEVEQFTIEFASKNNQEYMQLLWDDILIDVPLVLANS